MHWGVPFRLTRKRELTEDQQMLIDQASEKLVSLREAKTHPGDVELSESERTLLAAVAEDCLKECTNDPTELRLELKTDQPPEVLIERLRSPLHP